MSIHFNNAVINTPFAFDSIGNNWTQEKTIRPKGYPLFHYLQSQEGEGIIQIQNKEYTLSESEGILIAPFVPHSYEKKSGKWITSFVTFSGTIESSLPKILSNKKVFFINKEQGTRISALIEEILPKYDAPILDQVDLSIDCYHMLMLFAEKEDPRKFLEDPLYLAYISPVISEIETHYDKALTVSDLARQVFVTPQYLSRLFHKYLDSSTYEYLLNFRIAKAKELLMSRPSMEIQQVATKVGFGDSSHFIASFKKATGMTPYEFKKLN